MNAPTFRQFTVDGRSRPRRGQVAAPSLDGVIGDLNAQFVAETATKAAGFARSAARSARVGDMRATRVRLRQARLCALVALDVLDDGEGS